MTFLSVQSFDENEQIHTLKSVKRTVDLDTVKSNEHGHSTVKMKVDFETEAFGRDNLIPARNEQEAEQYVFENEIFWNLSTPPMNHVPEELRLAENIRRAAGNVATNSGRGTGNTVVYNPAVEHQIETVKEVYETSPAASMTFVASDQAPTDRVLVLYRGTESEDQPLIYVPGEGLLLNNGFTEVENYGKYVKI